ncbi:hypothetical protein OQJ19_11260 [Fluoribacter gormanii]|uniref:Phage minor tail protein n=1 Tax=Fluoribacter gormanii TaxID=464 RepID=A0A377GLZ6_9GAMM|nr:hypothetical protein [Fluoribacter gormanii]KTD05014.1 phage minor tail protein [Fluoribacter gormanii]MCW8442748.1 hypothetical protein [Fluoribacter gormanii]MCW8471222.1 hypothetical protein [Fluoribacter gormanii]SIR56069.1 hypothetical protein SAMN05421777_11562 [Fluoribacter gormanii]STO25644.1 Uncharacterised protein [Fluoribacter gormanii]
MFISKLIRIIEDYDPYGNHRVNGVKVTYVLLILFAVNFIFSIPNPYFYYFYIPITAMAAEVVGDTIKRKNVLLFYCIWWAVISAFLFDILSISPFFPIFAFFYSFFLYMVAIKSRMHTIVIAPVALSLGAYSLLYKDVNTSFYAILNNCLNTFIAMAIVFAALAFFPRSYYYRLWLRALILLISQIIEHLSLMVARKNIIFNPVRGHTTHLVRYATMLPQTFPLRSIWKINLLINQLHLIVCVIESETIILEPEKINLFIEKLHIFKRAIEKEQPCELAETPWSILNKLISSWNYLCLKL